MGLPTPDVDDKNLTKSENIIAYVFGGISEIFISTYETSDKARLKLLEEIVDNLDSLGVDMLSQVLAKSEDKEVRKNCVISLVKKGKLSRKWALGVLEKPDSPWYLQRNALKILFNVSQNIKDFERIRVHLDHENSKIREEMISLVVRMRPQDAESLIISALDDADVKVRWRATRALADISPISESAFNKILSIIKKPLSEDKDESAAQMKKIMNLISAISGLSDVPNKNKVEIDIINTLKAMIGQEKGLKKFFKRLVVSENEIGMLKAAIPLLGRIGGKESENFLKTLIKSHSQLSDGIQKSLENIQARNT
jgi:HEAT repeat protein